MEKRYDQTSQANIFHLAPTFSIYLLKYFITLEFITVNKWRLVHFVLIWYINLGQQRCGHYQDNIQEGCAVAGNHRTMQGTSTESLYLILGQHGELKEH